MTTGTGIEMVAMRSGVARDNIVEDDKLKQKKHQQLIEKISLNLFDQALRENSGLREFLRELENEKPAKLPRKTREIAVRVVEDARKRKEKFENFVKKQFDILSRLEQEQVSMTSDLFGQDSDYDEFISVISEILQRQIRLISQIKPEATTSSIKRSLKILAENIHEKSLFELGGFTSQDGEISIQKQNQQRVIQNLFHNLFINPSLVPRNILAFDVANIGSFEDLEESDVTRRMSIRSGYEARGAEESGEERVATRSEESEEGRSDWNDKKYKKNNSATSFFLQIQFQRLRERKGNEILHDVTLEQFITFANLSESLDFGESEQEKDDIKNKVVEKFERLINGREQDFKEAKDSLKLREIHNNLAKVHKIYGECVGALEELLSADKLNEYLEHIKSAFSSVNTYEKLDEELTRLNEERKSLKYNGEQAKLRECEVKIKFIESRRELVSLIEKKRRIGSISLTSTKFYKDNKGEFLSEDLYIQELELYSTLEEISNLPKINRKDPGFDKYKQKIRILEEKADKIKAYLVGRTKFLESKDSLENAESSEYDRKILAANKLQISPSSLANNFKDPEVAEHIPAILDVLAAKIPVDSKARKYSKENGINKYRAQQVVSLIKDFKRREEEQKKKAEEDGVVINQEKISISGIAQLLEGSQKDKDLVQIYENAQQAVADYKNSSAIQIQKIARWKRVARQEEVRRKYLEKADNLLEEFREKGYIVESGQSAIAESGLSQITLQDERGESYIPEYTAKELKPVSEYSEHEYGSLYEGLKPRQKQEIEGEPRSVLVKKGQGLDIDFYANGYVNFKYDFDELQMAARNSSLDISAKKRRHEDIKPSSTIGYIEDDIRLKKGEKKFFIATAADNGTSVSFIDDRVEDEISSELNSLYEERTRASVIERYTDQCQKYFDFFSYSVSRNYSDTDLSVFIENLPEHLELGAFNDNAEVEIFRKLHELRKEIDPMYQGEYKPKKYSDIKLKEYISAYKTYFGSYHKLFEKYEDHKDFIEKNIHLISHDTILDKITEGIDSLSTESNQEVVDSIKATAALIENKECLEVDKEQGRKAVYKHQSKLLAKKVARSNTENSLVFSDAFKDKVRSKFKGPFSFRGKMTENERLAEKALAQSPPITPFDGISFFNAPDSNIVSVTFKGTTENDTAWVYIPETNQCYIKVVRYERAGTHKEYNGKTWVNKNHEAGQIVIDAENIYHFSKQNKQYDKYSLGDKKINGFDEEKSSLYKELAKEINISAISLTSDGVGQRMSVKIGDKVVDEKIPNMSQSHTNLFELKNDVDIKSRVDDQPIFYVTQVAGNAPIEGGYAFCEKKAEGKIAGSLITNKDNSEVIRIKTSTFAPIASLADMSEGNLTLESSQSSIVPGSVKIAVKMFLDCDKKGNVTPKIGATNEGKFYNIQYEVETANGEIEIKYIELPNPEDLLKKNDDQKKRKLGDKYVKQENFEAFMEGLSQDGFSISSRQSVRGIFCLKDYESLYTQIDEKARNTEYGYRLFDVDSNRFLPTQYTTNISGDISREILPESVLRQENQRRVSGREGEVYGVEESSSYLRANSSQGRVSGAREGGKGDRVTPYGQRSKPGPRKPSTNITAASAESLAEQNRSQNSAMCL